MSTVKDLIRAFQSKPGNPRLMKYPYTFGGQIAQFPFKFYFQHNWGFRYWIFGCVACLPLFMWIGKQVNTPSNIAKWKEIRRKELLETHYLDGGHEH